MNVIEQNHQVDQNEAVPLRRRKVAVAHHSNNMVIQIDPNGNTRTFTRLSSLSETEPNSPIENEDTVTDNSDDDNGNISRDSVLWENSVLQQIQSLIKNVQVSDSLADCIKRELLLNNDTPDVNANIGPKFRRNSRFSITNNGHAQTTRRQSVTAIHQQKSQSLPRQRVSNAGLNNEFCMSHGRRSSVTNMNNRRPSFANGTCRRQSVSNKAVGRRRSSIAHPNIGGGSMAIRPDGRRNSVNHCVARRGSLAHAYQHSAMPPIRRRSVYSNDNMAPGSTHPSLQRRRSSVKPPCFPVTKISSVQKRINKIYKRRRRQDRAEVNIADVRKAFKGIRRETGMDSDSHCSDSGNVSKHESDNEYVDVNSNTLSCSDDNTIDTGLTTDNNTESDGTSDVVGDTSEEVSLTENPTPRRKTSIQVRSWELSRRLRQRRREKRKGFTESDLI